MVHNPSPVVSVIIVNWNRLADVRETIRVLGRGDEPLFEIIVVDNGSTDGSAEELSRVGAIRLISLGSNVGPAAARNVAMGTARGRYLFFLDSDASITRRDLRRLVDRMEGDPGLGVIGCRIVNDRTRAIDQWIYAEPMETFADREFETYAFSAAGALIRAEAIERAGNFWGELFIYNEEVDISIRIFRAGYRIIYSPVAEVLHRASDRGRVKPAGYWYYQIRNRIWIFFRYYPAGLAWAKVLFYIFIYLIKGTAALQVRASLKGVVDGLIKTDIIRSYRDKMSPQECRKLEALNRRKAIRLGR